MVFYGRNENWGFYLLAITAVVVIEGFFVSRDIKQNNVSLDLAPSVHPTEVETKVVKKITMIGKNDTTEPTPEWIPPSSYITFDLSGPLYSMAAGFFKDTPDNLYTIFIFDC